MEGSSRNLTEGSIVKKLLIFAVPYLIANFIQALYGAVDMMVVGWFANAAGISAVSVGSQVMQIVTSLVSGLTMGGTILIAQYAGARREKESVETISTMLTLFGLLAIVFTVGLYVLAEIILRLLQTPEEAFLPALRYVQICSCGTLFIFGYNAISAILRGLGDSKNPLIFVAIACGTNIILDLLFVGGFQMGAAGAALATILSQAVSVILAIIFLSRKDFIFQFRLKNFRIHPVQAKKLIQLGLPVSFQETMVSLSFLIIAGIVNTLGVIPSAAVGICGKFEGFAMLPAGAFSSAIASMAAQNIGAKKPDRARQCMWVGIGFSFLCSLFFFGWVQIFPESALVLFKADAQVVAAGIQYLRTFSFDFMFVSFYFCMNGFFNGCGRTAFTMANGVIATFAARIPLAFFLTKFLPAQWSLYGIGLAAPIATLLSIGMCAWYLKTNRWKAEYENGNLSPE